MRGPTITSVNYNLDIQLRIEALCQLRFPEMSFNKGTSVSTKNCEKSKIKINK